MNLQKTSAAAEMALESAEECDDALWIGSKRLEGAIVRQRLRSRQFLAVRPSYNKHKHLRGGFFLRRGSNNTATGSPRHPLALLRDVKDHIQPKNSTKASASRSREEKLAEATRLLSMRCEASMSIRRRNRNKDNTNDKRIIDWFLHAVEADASTEPGKSKGKQKPLRWKSWLKHQPHQDQDKPIGNHPLFMAEHVHPTQVQVQVQIQQSFSEDSSSANSKSFGSSSAPYESARLKMKRQQAQMFHRTLQRPFRRLHNNVLKLHHHSISYNSEAGESGHEQDSKSEMDTYNKSISARSCRLDATNRQPLLVRRPASLQVSNSDTTAARPRANITNCCLNDERNNSHSIHYDPNPNEHENQNQNAATTPSKTTTTSTSSRIVYIPRHIAIDLSQTPSRRKDLLSQQISNITFEDIGTEASTFYFYSKEVAKGGPLKTKQNQQSGTTSSNEASHKNNLPVSINNGEKTGVPRRPNQLMTRQFEIMHLERLMEEADDDDNDSYHENTSRTEEESDNNVERHAQELQNKQQEDDTSTTEDVSASTNDEGHRQRSLEDVHVQSDTVLRQNNQTDWDQKMLLVNSEKPNSTELDLQDLEGLDLHIHDNDTKYRWAKLLVLKNKSTLDMDGENEDEEVSVASSNRDDVGYRAHNH